jgi:hypothetical protein
MCDWRDADVSSAAHSPTSRIVRAHVNIPSLAGDDQAAYVPTADDSMAVDDVFHVPCASLTGRTDHEERQP